MKDDFPLSHILPLIETLYPECKTQEQKEEKACEIHGRNAINGELKLAKCFEKHPLPKQALIELGRLIEEVEIKQTTYILYSKIEDKTTEEQILNMLEELKSE